jgi:hypothetical protein
MKRDRAWKIRRDQPWWEVQWNLLVQFWIPACAGMTVKMTDGFTVIPTNSHRDSRHNIFAVITRLDGHDWQNFCTMIPKSQMEKEEPPD